MRKRGRHRDRDRDWGTVIDSERHSETVRAQYRSASIEDLVRLSVAKLVSRILSLYLSSSRSCGKLSNSLRRKCSSNSAGPQLLVIPSARAAISQAISKQAAVNKQSAVSQSVSQQASSQQAVSKQASSSVGTRLAHRLEACIGRMLLHTLRQLCHRHLELREIHLQQPCRYASGLQYVSVSAASVSLAGISLGRMHHHISMHPERLSTTSTGHRRLYQHGSSLSA